MNVNSEDSQVTCCCCGVIMKRADTCPRHPGPPIDITHSVENHLQTSESGSLHVRSAQKHVDYLNLEMRGEPTPPWESGNYTTREEYIDITFAVANSLILVVTSVVGIAANIFVILAVYHQKSLQTSNNALVVNLAVIDILRCVIDCPLLLTIVMTVYQRRHTDGLICEAQVASFSFSCCIQLLTLACISAERYQAIAQPFKSTQRRKRIMVLIPLTWTLAILVAGFCVTFLKDSPVHMRCEGLQESTSATYDTFGLYMLLPLWAVCFSVIIGFYTSIFILVRSHNRKIFDKGIFPLPKKEAETENAKNKVETTAVENGQTSERKQAQVEPGTQAEANSSKKGSSRDLLTSAKAPQSIPVDLENKAELENTLVVTDLETEQSHPPAMQVAAKTEEKPFKTEQSNSCATKTEEKPSNGDAVSVTAGVNSSTTKPQKVSSNFDTEKQSNERAKIDKAPSEMRETSLYVSSSAQLENPESTSALLIEPTQSKNSGGGETPPVAAVDQVSSLPPVSNNVPETDATKQNAEVEGAVCMMPSKASRERANKKKESKMAKRAGYIILTFLLFWLPLITTILLNYVVHKNKNTRVTVIQHVEILSVSIACITSLSDPIIYAAVNPQFRTEFYRLKNRVKSVFRNE